MSPAWQLLVDDTSQFFPPPELTGPPPDETEALDAFSRVVVHVAEVLRPPVVNVRGGRGRREGSGSGVLFTPDGFLLTNHHVINGIQSVRLRLADGREIAGRVVGADPWTDLAVVQAEGHNLPYARFGDSAPARWPTGGGDRQPIWF